MALTVDQFVKHLADSGLMTAEEIKAFQSDLPPDKNPKDGQELARELLRQKKLTKFQAEAVYQGKTKSLVLGNYVLLEKIGAGGMGQVFKAMHRRMERVVAVKVLPPAVTKDENAVKRFHREVKAAAKLSHPNIVTAYDADESNGVHFLVMECVEASDLSSIVKKGGPLPVGTAVGCILQAAKGLEYAHKKGVVHRDIKPANLLLDNEGVVKILDMGLARIEEGPGAAQQAGAAGLTNTGQIMGTIDYIPPEQALNTKLADHRADIYSLGCSLYYLMGGKALYGGETVMEKLLAHREKPIPSLRDLQQDAPNALDAVFKKMVAKEPEDRYQSMTEVIAGLQACDVGVEPATLSAASASRMSKNAGGVAVQKPTTAQAEETGVGQAAENTAAIHAVTRTMLGSGSRKKLLTILGALAAGILVAVTAGALLIFPKNNAKQPRSDTATDTKDDKGGEVDLLALIDPKRDAVRGEWRFEGKTLVTPKEGLARLQIPFSPLKEYELETTAILIAGNDPTDTPLGIGLIGGESQFMVALGVDPGDVNALDVLDKRLFNNNETSTKRLIFHKGKQTTIRCIVRTRQVVVISDGVTLINWRGDFSRLSQNPGWIVPDRTRLWIGSHKSVFHISKMVLRPLPDSEKAFNDWLASVQRMPAEEQVDAVAAKMKEVNPGFDGKVERKIENEIVTELSFSADAVTDISPVRSLAGLKSFGCYGAADDRQSKLTDLSPLKDMKLLGLFFPRTQVADLSPLKGMPLTYIDFNTTNVADLSPLRGMRLTGLRCFNTPVNDLAPLKGMPLTDLSCQNTRVADLAPLKGMLLAHLDVSATQVSNLLPLNEMPLTVLRCYRTKVSDLSPLKALPLKEFFCDFKPERDAAILRSIKTLEKINNKPAKEFWKDVESQQAGMKPLTTLNDPTFQKWMNDVAVLPAEKQVEAVAKKLQELNPGFDGKVVEQRIENGAVVRLLLKSNHLKNLAPVKSLSRLDSFSCDGTDGNSQLEDLSPLGGLKLTFLNCIQTKVRDLAPVHDMPLKGLNIDDTQVKDLTPLKEMTLSALSCRNTKVADLSPLKGMPLSLLICDHTLVTDLSPLEKMPLRELHCDFKPERDAGILRSIKTLAKINNKPAAEFWKEVEATQKPK